MQTQTTILLSHNMIIPHLNIPQNMTSFLSMSMDDGNSKYVKQSLM